MVVTVVLEVSVVVVVVFGKTGVLVPTGRVVFEEGVVVVLLAGLVLLF